MITALGDSIIKGVIVRQEDAQSLRPYSLSEHNILDLCADKLHMSILNLGKFGCTITAGKQILERNRDQLVQSKYILTEYGGNDSDYDWADIAANPTKEHLPRTPLNTFISGYEEVIDQISSLGRTPILLSLPPIDADRYFRFFTRQWTEEQRNRVIQWLGGSTSAITYGHELYNLQVCQLALRKQVPWVDITTPLVQNHRYTEFLCIDGIHPNEKGQQQIAQIITSWFTQFAQYSR